MCQLYFESDTGITNIGVGGASGWRTVGGSTAGVQPTPTAKTADATLTVAELLTRIVTATKASAVALTLPTGTLTDAGFLGGAAQGQRELRVGGHQPRLVVGCRHHDCRHRSHLRWCGSGRDLDFGQVPHGQDGAQHLRYLSGELMDEFDTIQADARQSFRPQRPKRVSRVFRHAATVLTANRRYSSALPTFPLAGRITRPRFRALPIPRC
jgi:hypothetical protein